MRDHQFSKGVVASNRLIAFLKISYTSSNQRFIVYGGSAQCLHDPWTSSLVAHNIIRGSRLPYEVSINGENS